MENEVFRGEPFTRAQAWLWFIEKAAFADTKHHGKPVKRGQLYTTLGRLSREWKWPRARVQRCLRVFCDRSMIDTSSDTDGRLITICNYDKYQAENFTGDSHADTDPIQTRYRPDTRNKEGKKEESIVRPNGLTPASAAKSNRREVQKEFDEIWPLFPRKRDKGHALKAFIAARKTTALDVIEAGIKQFARDSEGKEPQFVAYPASWLNGQRWLDEKDQPNGRNGELSFYEGPTEPAPTLEEIKIRMERSHNR